MPFDASLLDKLSAASVESKELLRELHKAIKDCKQILKEIESKKADLVNTAQSTVDSIIYPIVDSRAKDITETLDKINKNIENNLYSRFEQLTNILMFGDKKGGTKSLVEDMLKIREAALIIERYPLEYDGS